MEFRVSHRYLLTMAALELNIIPLDPRFKSSSETLEFRVLNLAAITATILIAAPVFYIAGRGFYRRLHLELPAEPLPPQGPQPSRNGFGVEGGGVRRLFLQFIRFLEAISKVPYRGSYTLREYGNLISGRLPGEVSAFVSSVLLSIERIIYGPPAKGESLSSLLRSAIRRLKRTIKVEV